MGLYTPGDSKESFPLTPDNRRIMTQVLEIVTDLIDRNLPKLGELPPAFISTKSEASKELDMTITLTALHNMWAEQGTLNVPVLVMIGKINQAMRLGFANVGLSVDQLPEVKDETPPEYVI